VGDVLWPSTAQMQYLNGIKEQLRLLLTKPEVVR
jgi:hypothetical protein